MTRALVPFAGGFAAGLAVLLATDGSPVAYVVLLVGIVVVGVAQETRRSR